MRALIITLLLTFACYISQAQNATPDSMQVLDYAAQMPEYPGGQAEMTKFLLNNLHYPDAARSNAVNTKIVARFIVSRDGHLSDIEVVSNVLPVLRDAVLDAIEKMPNWIPGRQNGKLVNVLFTLPITIDVE